MGWIVFAGGVVVGAFGMAYACNKWEWLARKIVRETQRLGDQAEDLVGKVKR
jgi:hypothetical protein